MTQNTPYSSAQKVLIAPSILSADFSRLADQIKIVEKAGADWIHVDVMDAHFVPNLTMGPVVVHWIRKATPLPLDVHLMIDDPWTYASHFAQSGADIITFHYESCRRSSSGLIRKIKRLGKKVGISVCPKTPASAILPYLSQLDLVLVMTVEPGFGGQKFMPGMLSKIHQLKNCIGRKKIKCKIEVDGGINQETALLAIKAGADVLVVGNSIFGHKKPSEAFKKLRKLIDK